MTAPAPPPPGMMFLDSHAGLVWRPAHDGATEFYANTPNGQTWSTSWADLVGGKYGDIQMLVPVPYDAGDDPAAAASVANLAENLLAPALAMARQLADALGVGYARLLLEAERRAELAGAKRVADHHATVAVRAAAAGGLTDG